MESHHFSDHLSLLIARSINKILKGSLCLKNDLERKNNPACRDNFKYEKYESPKAQIVTPAVTDSRVHLLYFEYKYSLIFDEIQNRF
jgi:hypothetical protein